MVFFLTVFWLVIPHSLRVPKSASDQKNNVITYYRSLIHSVFVLFSLLVFPTTYYPGVILVSQSYFIADLLLSTDKILIIHHICSIIGFQGVISYPIYSEYIITTFLASELTNTISHTDSLLRFCKHKGFEWFSVFCYILIRVILGGYYNYTKIIKSLDMTLECSVLAVIYNIIYFGSVYHSIITIKTLSKQNTIKAKTKTKH